MNFEVSVEQMAEMTAAVVERDRLRGQLRDTEAKNARMRKQLTDYQSICERAKKATVEWLKQRAAALGISVNELVNRIAEKAMNKEVAK